jgi:hypothetical protein
VAADDVHPDDMPDDRLDAFFDELRTAAAEAPLPVVGDALATLFRDGQAPVVSAAPVVRRRRWSARAAIAGAIAGVTFGGLGVAGALPGPVQRGVADVVRQVGVHLPDPAPATTSTTSTTVAPTPASTTSTTVERGTSDEHRQDELDVEDRGRSDEHRQDGDSSGRGGSDENRQDGDSSGRGGSDDRSKDDEEDDNRGSGRNPSTAGDVHPDDDPQAADRRDNDHGGSSE